MVEFKLLAPVADEDRDPTFIGAGIRPVDAQVAEADVAVRLACVGKQRSRGICGEARHVDDRVAHAGASDLHVRWNRDAHAGSRRVPILPSRNRT